MDLLAAKTHCIIVGAVRRAGGALGHMPARQTGLIERLCVHYGMPRRALERQASLPPRNRTRLQLKLEPAGASQRKVRSRSSLNKAPYSRLIWRKRGENAAVCGLSVTVVEIRNAGRRP